MSLPGGNLFRAFLHILFYEKPDSTRMFNPESRYGLNEKNGDGRSLNNTDSEDVRQINRCKSPVW
jgi:hypothetical protein